MSDNFLPALIKLFIMTLLNYIMEVDAKLEKKII